MTSFGWKTISPIVSSLPVLFLFSVGSVSAQTGTISGRVVDAATLQPLLSVQLAVPAARIGTISQADGRYTIVNVPPGTHQVAVSRIGYVAVTQPVTVTAGATAILNFELRSAAITLDAIVVTGSGVLEEKRRLGSSSATVAANVISERAQTAMSSALRGQVAGLVVTAPRGDAGAASPIRIRAQTSLTQRQEPILYVDGVRQDNSMMNVARGPVGTSRMDDLNPSDIERIEIIKGAAAATLFGTEASAGVIQIFTKRGAAGPAQYSFSMDQGATRINRSSVDIIQVYDRPNKQFLTQDPYGFMLRTGHLQNYNLSISGGLPTMQYFVSARAMKESGATPGNWVNNIALRSNIDMAHGEKLRTQTGLNVIRNYVQMAGGDAGTGLLAAHTVSNPLLIDLAARRPFGETFITVEEAIGQDLSGTTNRYTLDNKISYQWTEDVASQLTVGYNWIHDEGSRAVGLEEGILRTPFNQGWRSIDVSKRSALTVDANTAVQRRFSDQVQLQLWAGGQFFREILAGSGVSVSNMPAPGLKTLNSGSRIVGVTEQFQEVVNAGVFGQAQLDIANRFFLTAGLRGDGNSAFGENFGMSLYPKLSGSYVLSDESFWPDSGPVSVLRLRSSFGQSGLQPGAFDAVQTWVPRVRLGGVSVVWPGAMGNPDLKPERSTEIEFGADVGLFNNRLGLDLTHYRQKTTDAITPRPHAATLGFTSPQLLNLGVMESKGYEAQITATMIEKPAFGWSMSTSIAKTDQKIVDLGLGETTFYRVGGGGSRVAQFMAEGYPAGVLAAVIVDEDDPYHLTVPVEKFNRLEQLIPHRRKDASGADSLHLFKGPVPTLNISIGSDVRLPRGFSLRGLVTSGSGFTVSSEGDLIWKQNKTHPLISNWEAELDDPNTTAARRKEIADAYVYESPEVHGNYAWDGDFIRISELAMSYRVPETFTSRMGLTNLSMTLSGENLMIWTKADMVGDPGAIRSGSFGSATPNSVQRYEQPSARRLTLGFRGAW